MYSRDAGSWIQDPRCWILQPGSRVLDPVSRVLDPVSRVLDPVSRIQGPGSCILDAGCPKTSKLEKHLIQVKHDSFTYQMHIVKTCRVRFACAVSCSICDCIHLQIWIHLQAQMQALLPIQICIKIRLPTKCNHVYALCHICVCTAEGQ